MGQGHATTHTTRHATTTMSEFQRLNKYTSCYPHWQIS